jgi:hypothetical protein
MDSKDKEAVWPSTSCSAACIKERIRDIKSLNDNNLMHKKRNLLPIICTLLIVAVMVYASELAHEKEIIFPEIAAIAAGALLSLLYHSALFPVPSAGTQSRQLPGCLLL